MDRDRRLKVYLSHMWDNTGAAAGDVFYEMEIVDGSTFDDTLEGDDFSTSSGRIGAMTSWSDWAGTTRSWVPTATTT